jgi:hypothetical protein
MALHKDLPIYKAAYDLLSVTTEITRNIPRDFKRLIGEKVREECVEILVLIFRANVAAHKIQYIEALLERVRGERDHPVRHLLHPSLVLRSTTAPPPSRRVSTERV